jgi:hypothetical protein
MPCLCTTITVPAAVANRWNTSLFMSRSDRDRSTLSVVLAREAGNILYHVGRVSKGGAL